MLKLYNTETRSKEVITPITEVITLYTCGPTVYDYAHIGNFRTYLFEDMLRRTLLFLGYRVKQVMNITDVDDKTIKGAIKNQQTLKEYTEPYEQAFFEDLRILNIQEAEYYPEATKYIEQMITIIEDLLKKGYAYRAEDQSIYFSIKKFPNYGRLSHLHLQELKKGASDRINLDEYDKENAADFVLWKSYDPERDGSIFWESPFGKGRPGWHIECSAMALNLLGETIDIHCGGVDNIFPHHENEIAQSEAYTKKTFVRYWVHAAHLIVDNRKMAKSANNFYTLRDLLEKGYSGSAIRYMLIHTHYRSPLNFTFEGLEACRASLDRIRDFLFRIRGIEEESEEQIIDEKIQNTEKRFVTALCDDLNISSALASLFDFIHEVHVFCDQKQIGKNHYQKILAFFSRLNNVLGFLPLDEPRDIPQEVIKAKEQREQARKEKDWKRADELRQFILSKGYAVEDGYKESILKKK